ncbi:MAG: DEAD/DEAH box helicase, partial [Myxococcales bacterium]|nr:DEAD/DEAH box helicase [Myxococcales bacterium]
PGLQATLRPYQREGLDWLQHLAHHDVGGILADDMGLGKTLQTIAHLLAEHASGRAAARPSLVVAPTSLTTNWQREIARFAPSLRVVLLTGSRARRHPRYKELARADVVVTSYPVLLRDEDRLAAHDFHLLVLDEAQAIKNPRSRVRRAVCALEARHRLCLSGTPIENNLGELWSLFDFLNPGQLGDSARFAQAFRKPIERDGEEAPLRALRRRVGPFILRRTKDEVARELPPKTEIVRTVGIRGAQRDLYESIRVAAHAKVREAIAEKGIARSTITILDALMKLRQVCCDPRLVRVRAAADVRASAKLEAALTLLEHQLREGRRVLLFSQFTSMLALIANELAERDVRALSLTGATPDRQRRIDAFCAGEADVFLISLKAGGTGLNLTSADTVIHYDPWWNPAAQAQATDRAYRIGQTKPVFVYNLIVAGSVEERMLALQQRKRQLAEGIYGAASGGLGEGEVESLLAPLD